MIPADRITIDGDEAWWVVEYPAPLDQPTIVALRALNRPCNHCEGTEWLDVEDINCDCIDGRHTFPVEVDDCCGLVEPFCHVTTYRAAIIEVLPIVARPPTETRTRARCSPFPSAAAPGMYAVRLKLAKEEK